MELLVLAALVLIALYLTFVCALLSGSAAHANGWPEGWKWIAGFLFGPLGLLAVGLTAARNVVAVVGNADSH